MIIAIGAIAIGIAFRSLLIEQAKAVLVATTDQIALVAEGSNTLGFNDPETALDTLANREQLDQWASINRYVQIDSPKGYPIGKSSNMGDLRLSALPPGVTQRFTFARDTDGSPLLELDRLLSRNGKPVVIAHVAERLDIVDEVTRRAQTILIFAAVVACIAVVIASLFIARSLVDPVVRLTGAMEEIGSEQLDRRLHWKRGDEIGRLAATFDAMLDRLQGAFARERQFISDASHEFKTPLTVINANAQLIRRWGDGDPAVRADSVAAIADESARLAEMVGGMLTLAKADSGDQIPKEPLALNPLVADVVAHLRERAAQSGLELRAELDPNGPYVLGDTPLIRQLVSNLVDNAIKFTERGEVVVGVHHAPGIARITISDTGIGIAPETAERLFDRFFRGDPSHSRIIEGTGLGLAIVRSIARVHGGTVSAAPRPEGGSVFTVELPAIEVPPGDPLLTEIQ
ncbi:MAG TPA: HAMP domain-containing sensor histidine kinase [Candidatus Lustribacter sp.]|nr:HAMP domain-containing sensor histidine kinase [Candidatus Lustribacter sp.]